MGVWIFGIWICSPGSRVVKRKPATSQPPIQTTSSIAELRYVSNLRAPQKKQEMSLLVSLSNPLESKTPRIRGILFFFRELRWSCCRTSWMWTSSWLCASHVTSSWFVFRAFFLMLDALPLCGPEAVWEDQVWWQKGSLVVKWFWTLNF